MTHESRRTKIFTDLERLLRAAVGDFGGVYAADYNRSDPRGKVLANKKFANFLYETLASEIPDESSDHYKKALSWLMHNGNKPGFDPAKWAHGVLTGRVTSFESE